MSDPLNPWEEKDRMPPSGDLSPMPEGTGRAPDDDENAATQLRSAAAAQGATDADPTDADPAGADANGTDANDLEADNAVEADTIETLDPENPPA